MSHSPGIAVMFLDIGGVLLTNGWDRHSRRRAAETFGLDPEEMNERHHLTFDTYEEGKLSLDEYLRRVVFYQDRPFTPEQFKAFMFAQSQPLTENIDFIRRLARQFGLRVGAISNEGRELTIHRIATFRLSEFVDFFISSCFVHFRKPDADMYRIALDIGQVEPARAVYIDDRPMFVEVAQGLGIHGICHRDLESTRQVLAGLGLALV